VAPVAGRTGPTVMTQPWPLPEPKKIDEHAEADVAWLQAFVLGVRQIRGELDISPAKPLPVLMQNATQADVDRMARLKHFVTFLATDLAAGNPITDPSLDFGVHVITLTQ
jgi:valyl-tRNA synthetase